MATVHYFSLLDEFSFLDKFNEKYQVDMMFRLSRIPKKVFRFNPTENSYSFRLIMFLSVYSN